MKGKKKRKKGRKTKIRIRRIQKAFRRIPMNPDDRILTKMNNQRSIRTERRKYRKTKDTGLGRLSNEQKIAKGVEAVSSRSFDLLNSMMY